MPSETSASKIGKSVGERLRAARIAQNFTQSQLAEPDFSVSYISAIERGQIHPSLRALEILSARLGLTSTQLLPPRTQHEDRHTSTPTSSTNEDEEEAELALFEAHILILQGLPEKALSHLSKLGIRRLKLQQQIEHRYLQGEAYVAANQLQTAEQILSEAAEIAKEANDQYLNIRIHNLLGIIYASMRNYTQAIFSHQRCLNLLEGMAKDESDAFLHVQICMQLGQHYAHQENYERAHEMFDNAVALADALVSMEQVHTVYTALCQHYAALKEYSLATLYAYKCIQLSDRERRKRLKSELHHYLGHAMMKLDQEKARDYLQTASQQAQQQHEPYVQASVAIRLAEWYFTHQQLDEAENQALFAYNATNVAQSHTNRAGKENVIIAEALITLGRIEYARSRYEDGDRHFAEGLAMLERLGKQEELVEQAAYYANLLEERGKEREAFTYFRRAFQGSQKLAR